MKSNKRKKLETAGWKVGSAKEFTAPGTDSLAMISSSREIAFARVNLAALSSFHGQFR